MDIQERLNLLREKMREQGMDAYMIPTADFHESEYAGDYFKCREYMTGFTGSAGTAVVTLSEAALWTDGRYFVQAGEQLKNSTVTLMKMGEEGVPELEDYLAEKLPESGCLGFDGRVVNSQEGERIASVLESKFITLSTEHDLVGEIWTDRPALSAEPVWILGEEYAGKSAAEKIGDLRAAMKAKGADIHLLTTLDDIVWLLNIRGNDVACNPVVLSYAAVTENEFFLFVNPKVLNQEVRQYLTGLGVTVKPYNEIYEYVKTLDSDRVMVEKSRLNYAILNGIDETNTIIDCMNPTVLAKAIKNPVEIENMKKAHIKDGVVMTRFTCWLKKNAGKIPMDELSVQNKLDGMRLETEGNLGLSFDTISAYGANAAMCHYSATKESNTVIEPKGFYLVDSGGQYLEGTTDITRTIAMGPLTQEEKEHYTLVLMSMLRLGNVKFPYGARGITLDYAARQVFWERGLNFNHGTGHGVGYLLNVHERPVGIRWKMVPERQDSCVLEPGMVTSDEPGIYIENSHGIRTENLMTVVKDEKNEYGQFLRFEFLTYVPIDVDGIEKSLMTEQDICLLNAYHKQVYDKISPYLEGEEKEWLKDVTKAI